MTLTNEQVLGYYSRRDIQKELLSSAKDREVAVRFKDGGFGRRPDTLQFETDILEFAKQGVTSFHISEERWVDPLDLKTGMNRKQLDELRSGWDLVLDIDSPEVKYSKILSELLYESLKFHDITNVGCKFSGNKGFHLIVPFESMPDSINNTETKLLFPEAARIIASYLISMVEKPFRERIAALKCKLDIEDLLKVDTVLISSRHMFRAPYSLHEKSGLASIPIDIERISEFEKEDAQIEKVITNIPFINYSSSAKNEIRNLLLQAYDWDSRNKKIIIMPEKEKVVKEFEELDYKVELGFFPPCIKKGLEGVEDGKKRFLFILLNFLKSVGWNYEETEDLAKEWNEKNEEPLKETYLLSQLSWHKRQTEKRLPPNCSNIAYYKDLRLCEKDNLCQRIKNPANYAVRKSRYTSKKKKAK
ncbi:hypothetical protein HOD61_02405 [archaeon]|jgi:hypothetical protein|nr:hypothetical protein [archaeon]